MLRWLRLQYPTESPLLFNVCIDPSEGMPLSGALPSGSNPGPSPPFPAGPQPEVDEALSNIVAAYKRELATFVHGSLVEPDLLPGEKTGEGFYVRLCCDKDPFKPPPGEFTCDCNGPPYSGPKECASTFR